MRILITGGDHPLARLAIEHLHPLFDLRVVDNHFASAFPPGLDAQTGDLRDEAFVTAVVKNVELLLHFAPLSLTGDDERANLEQATLGAYQLAHAARKAGVGRIILGSTMALFATAPQGWRITEQWRPRPQPTQSDLCAWLAECGLREIARDHGLPVICVRFGAPDATAVAALQQALVVKVDGWRVLHAAQKSPIATSPVYPAIASRPIQKVVIFGSGGPLAATAALELAPHYQLRLTDVKPLATIIAEGPRRDQHPGAPLAVSLAAPHDEMVVDVTDAAQVLAACAGADAIVNCTVVRHHVAGSFSVNVVGAYNVMQAAVTHGIRRVVHTGPFQLGLGGGAGYSWDTLVGDDVPARPGSAMVSYLHTKYLGQEVCRIFAEAYQLETPALLFCDFADLVYHRPHDASVHPFTVTWGDAARAIRCALETPTLPSPFELLHINADLPHGVFPNEKAKRMIGWQPLDALESWWPAEETAR